MKNTILIPAIGIAAMLISCEKVVNIDLNNGAEQYVVEANIYEGHHPFQVDIHKTTDYYGNAKQQDVNDAQVWLYSSGSDSVLVPSAGNGSFRLPSFNGVPGKEYSLKVITGTHVFTATTSVPHPVKVDSVGYEFKEADFSNEGYEVYFAFTDPADYVNSYRIKLVVNDTVANKTSDLFFLNDKFSNGRPLKIAHHRRFKEGDKVVAELLAIDEQSYLYFSSLYDVLNDQNGPAPTNPVSNMRGGALGYFGGVASMKKAEIIIPTR
jgi:hypothetical protein